MSSLACRTPVRQEPPVAGGRNGLGKVSITGNRKIENTIEQAAQAPAAEPVPTRPDSPCRCVSCPSPGQTRPNWTSIQQTPSHLLRHQARIRLPAVSGQPDMPEKTCDSLVARVDASPIAPLLGVAQSWVSVISRTRIWIRSGREYTQAAIIRRWNNAPHLQQPCSGRVSTSGAYKKPLQLHPSQGPTCITPTTQSRFVLGQCSTDNCCERSLESWYIMALASSCAWTAIPGMRGPPQAPWRHQPALRH